MAPLSNKSPKAEIVAFQRAIAALGGDLGHHGADGVIGQDTRSAAHDVADTYGLPHGSGGVFPLAMVEEVLRLAQLHGTESPLPKAFVDLSDMAGHSRWRVRQRAWREIDAITLHQTAGRLGERHARWADHRYKDPETGQLRRTALKAHVGITRGGQVLLVHPLHVFGWHAQGLSHRSIGFEFDGTYAGLRGRRETWWAPPGVNEPDEGLTDAQVEAGCDAIRWVAAELARHGSRLRFVDFHRNASDDRRSDPGQDIVARVYLRMIAELGLELRPVGFKTGRGLPTPEVWDPRCKGIPY